MRLIFIITGLLVFNFHMQAQNVNNDIQEIRNKFKEINDDKSEYELYDLYSLQNDGIYVLVPHNSAEYLEEIDEIMSLYIYGTDTLISDGEYNTTFYMYNGKIQLIEEYYSDYPEAMSNNYESFYFNNNRLFFFYARYQETNYWVEPDNCCPSAINERRYYYKNDEVIRSLEKNLETIEYQNPDAIDDLPNTEIYTEDGYGILERANEYLNAKVLK
ncbi:MAG: hypothetical protein JXB49_35160 [Bacteroidales bacterium]|nr:hypothetical protein [Bacteroidales bacterium]